MRSPTGSSRRSPSKRNFFKRCLGSLGSRSGQNLDSNTVQTIFGPKNFAAESLGAVLVGEFLIHKSLPISNAAAARAGIQTESAGAFSTGGTELLELRKRPLSNATNLSSLENDATKEIRNLVTEVTRRPSKSQAASFSSLYSAPASGYGETLLVELTSQVHGRDVKGLIELSEKNRIHIVCASSPDDNATAWNPLSSVPPGPSLIEQVANRMTSEIQVGIPVQQQGSDSRLPTSRVVTGLIGPIFLRFTPTSGSQSVEIHSLDSARIKAAVSASSQMDGVPLLFFWNHHHSVNLLQKVLSLVGLYGGNAAVAKSAFFNPLVRSNWWATATVSPKPTELLHYDLSGVYAVLQAGAYVGFTCGGCGHGDTCFNDLASGNGDRADAGDAFWVGKSPISSPSDLVRILHRITSLHPPENCSWVCTGGADLVPETSAVEGAGGTESLGASFSPKTPSSVSPSASMRSCRCLDEIRTRVMISSGMALKADFSENGGGGLGIGGSVEQVFRQQWQGGGATCVGSKRAPPDLWRNAIEFLAFARKPISIEAAKGAPGYSCHWCSKEVTKKSEMYEKNAFVYCSMKCLNEHRKLKFSAARSKASLGG